MQTITHDSTVGTACTVCGADRDLTHEHLCRDRVGCWARVVVADYEAGRIDAASACNRLLSCYRVAADPVTTNLAYCHARAIEEAEDALHERYALTQRGRTAVAS